MSNTRITTGAVEPISVYAVNAAGNPLTGLTDLYVRIRRVSDGFFLDWTGMTFKSTGWTTLNKILAEASATNAPGVYEVTGGLNTGAITNVTADDDYQVIPLQTPGVTARLPGPGVISVGKWADRLDANVSTRATQAQILSDATPFQGARIDAAISSRATQAQILSDATPFPGARIDAAVSSRATQAQILSDATPFQGARIDAAISSRAVPADVQSGLTAQGYTAARATKLDDLDATVSSRATQAQILSDATPFQGARIDAAISSRAVPGDVQSGLTAQGYTVARAGNLDNLDAAVTTRATPADVPAGMTTQGYTTGRAPKLDALDANVSTRATQAQILSDATPFAGADIGLIKTAAQAVDTRLPVDPADESNIQAAIANVQADTTAILADTAVMEPLVSLNLDAKVSTRATQAQILSDTTPFAGADVALIKAAAQAVDTRLPADPADESNIQSAIANVQADTTAILADTEVIEPLVSGNLDAQVSTRATQAQILSDATPFPGARIDAAISSRAVPNDVTAGLTSQGYTTIRAPKLDNLDAAITSRAAPGAQMALTTPAVDGVVNSLWDEPTSGHVTPGTTGKALLDAGAVSDPLVIAAAVWDKAAASHTSPGTMGQLENRLDAAISTRAEPGDAMTLQPNSVDASTLAASGATKVRDTILSDATRFEGAKIDAAVSSRAEPGAAMDLVANAVDAASVAATGATKIGGAVWDESLAGHNVPGSAGQAQGRLDALVSSRAAPGAAMALTANALDDNAVATTGANKIRDSILSDATRIAGARIDAAISSRAAIGDQMGLSPSAVSTVVAGAWNEPIAGHVAPGTTGKALKDAGITADIPAIVAGVWDEPRSGHTTSGTMGESQEQGSVVAAQVEKIDQAATVAPASAAPGSLLDRLCNKGAGRTFDQTTDSLEAIRDRVG